MTEKTYKPLYPDVPSYIDNPVKFVDRHLGPAMAGTWGICGRGRSRWIFRVGAEGQWVSVREATADDLAALGET